jgi:nitrogen fixation/metabolism regulation signal transduction histidine kinase
VEVVTESAPDAVLFFSDLGRIRYANAAARELFFEGRSPEGENFITLVARAPAPLREALLGDSDRLFSVEVDGQHETYHVSRRSFPLEAEIHTVLTVRHMTREIARREVDVLKRVVRILSHEINNSLAPISSLVHSARLITKGPPDRGDKLTRVFDTIEERASHLKTFLEGYAAVARLPQPRPRRVEWAPFLRQLAELHPEAKLPQAPAEPGYFDPVQFEQVAINLLKNAAEAGGDRSAVEVGLSVGPDGGVDFEVRDRGPGFSTEALSSALLPLYTTKERGSGMGLALCREIVEAHGGGISIANGPNGGAVVRVRLPGRVTHDLGNVTRSRLTLSRNL